MAFLKHFLFGKTNFSGDEFRISRYFGLWEWLVPALVFVMGLIVSLYILFRVIPFKYRFSFILTGLFGGILGYALWFKFLGPVVLP